MAYTWTTGETITAEKLNNTGGGWDLVVKMSTLVPISTSTFTVISGDTAENLYDKFVDGNPIAILLLGYNMSGNNASAKPWICYAFTTSVPDTIFFVGISSGYETWPSWAQIQYDSNGISFV